MAGATTVWPVRQGHAPNRPKPPKQTLRPSVTVHAFALHLLAANHVVQFRVMPYCRRPKRWRNHV